MCFLKPWRTEELVAIWKTEPLPPFQPRTELRAVGLNFALLVWRCILGFLVLLASATVALSLSEQRERDPNDFFGDWFSDSSIILSYSLAAVWLWAWVRLGFTVWRITSRESWKFPPRAFIATVVTSLTCGFFGLLLITSIQEG